jgi:hypothetical protein
MMIIPEDKKVPLESPPAYSPSAQNLTNTTTPTPDLPQLPPPTNFLNVFKKDGRIRGEWVIDPSLSIPEGLLGPIPNGHTERPNVHLYSKDGAIRADLHFVAGDGPLKAEKVTVVVKSSDGDVNLKLHRNPGGPKLALRVENKDGPTKILLPSDFDGPITYKEHGSRVSFASNLKSRLTTFSMNSEGTSHVYLGDSSNLTGANASGTTLGDPTRGEWKGDEIFVENYDGMIKFMWIEDDDEKLQPKTSGSSKSGLLNKLLKRRAPSTSQQN